MKVILSIITKPTIGAIEKAINGAPKPPTPVKVMRPRWYYECVLDIETIVKNRVRGHGEGLVTESKSR